MQTDSYAVDAEKWRKSHALVSSTEVQAFFQAFADEIKKPTIGDKYKEAVKVVLLRATEAGLYKEGE